MLGKLFGKERKIEIPSPLSGEIILMSKVSDPTFSDGLLGKGVAIKPDGGRVVAPVNGTVSQMFETGHAAVLTSDDGAEVLIHVGLDTVRLKGRHFTAHVSSGDAVKAGDLLMEFDADAIAAEGYETVTPIVVVNSSDFESVTAAAADGSRVSELDGLLVIKK